MHSAGSLLQVFLEFFEIIDYTVRTAFNIIPHLGQLNSTPYSGATGTLSLNRENRISRELVCAKFINGKPELQDFNIEPEITDDQSIIYSDDYIQ